MSLIKALEFFSGIGGLHLSFKNALKIFPLSSGCELNIIKAFEMNEFANHVYKKNFPETDISSKNIESLTVNDIPKSDIWLLSPPCQPFTKGGSNRDSSDNRTKPFLKLIELMHNIGDRIPRAWFVENVINFETSDTHNIMVDMLNRLNFTVFEFIISPTIIGIPNSRVRYYCIAIRDNITNVISNNNHLTNSYISQYKIDFYNKFEEYNAYKLLSNKGNSKLEYKNIICHLPFNKDKCERILSNYFNKPNSISDIVKDFSKDEINKLVDISINMTKSNPSFKFDIVNKYSKVSTTFSKSYIRTKGRGGPLLNFSSGVKPHHFSNDTNIFNHIFNTSSLDPSRFQEIKSFENSEIRCFHPVEILSIMGFPDSWFDGTNLSLAKQYSLIGNSISIYVVTILFYFLLEIIGKNLNNAE